MRVKVFSGVFSLAVTSAALVTIFGSGLACFSFDGILVVDVRLWKVGCITSVCRPLESTSGRHIRSRRKLSSSKSTFWNVSSSSSDFCV